MAVTVCKRTRADGRGDLVLEDGRHARVHHPHAATRLLRQLGRLLALAHPPKWRRVRHETEKGFRVWKLERLLAQVALRQDRYMTVT